MRRNITNVCPICHRKYRQDWEDPDECPYCNKIKREEDDK